VIACPSCRHENADDLAFCASCGAALNTGESTQVHAVLAAGRPLTPQQQALVADVPAGVGLLVVERGPNAGSRYLLDGDRTTVGRHPDSEVFLDDITVSRRHAALEREPGGYRLRDVGSLNGSYINDARIDDVLLASGDTLQIGRYHLVFLVGPSGS
jgi:pSer/pThr/pTyr-binding forkhead associated (FHA) protein